MVAGSAGLFVSHALSFAARGCLVCCGALVSRGAPISACLLPVGLWLAPCTDFADWERVSPAPLLVSLQLAISLSLEFLESRRCQADPVTPPQPPWGVCCCDGCITHDVCFGVNTFCVIFSCAQKSPKHGRKKAPSRGACVGVVRLGWPMAPGLSEQVRPALMAHAGGGRFRYVTYWRGSALHPLPQTLGWCPASSRQTPPASLAA